MSFRYRLLISFSLLIAITFGAGGTVLISTSFQSLLNEEKTSAINAYETTQNNLLMLSFFGESGNYDNMSAMLSQMEQQQMARWQAISLTDGKECIYESGDQSLLSDEMKVSDSRQYVYRHIVDEKGRRLLMYSELSAGEGTLFLKASFDLTAAYHMRENQQRLFFMIYAVVVMLGILMASVLSLALTKHLRSLTGTARKIADGDLSRRSSIQSEDEFGQLSRDFDLMADKLQANILQLEEDVQRKEAFMGAVAHELKTPLTSIIGYADLIRQCSLDENGRITASNYIFKEGQRLEKLSFKLLDLLLLEKDAMVMREVCLDTFLETVIHTLSPMAEEKQVKLVSKGESAKVFFEPDLVKSLLYNLVDNAIKSMDTGGAVMIKGQAIPGGCRFQVLDNGCGMEEEELSRITEAFYRVDKSRSRKQGGAGLGLTLCKRIVDLHQGNMTFRSIKGKGSCVIVELYGRREDENEENETV